MQNDDFFPQGVAIGKAFLGREQELKWLENNIKLGHHTLLLAPRRYGKTSLALNTLKHMAIPYVAISLHLAFSPKSVEKKIFTGVQTLIKSCIGQTEHILQLAQRFFKKARKDWSIGFKGIAGLQLSPENHDDIPDNIYTVLHLLDTMLMAHDKQAVLFIDEFQELQGLELDKQLQGALREFAQTSKNLTLIFSGSNRRILQHMFDDDSMPLYELCDRLHLNRIGQAYYEKYLNTVAKKTWGQTLDGSALTQIFQLSELHPRRIYDLCNRVWKNYQDKKTPPTTKEIEAAWYQFIELRLRDIRARLSRLSAGQLKLLTVIASGVAEALTGKAVQQRIDMTSPSITQALHVLEDADLVELLENKRYRVLDPVVKEVLIAYEHADLGL